MTLCLVTTCNSRSKLEQVIACTDVILQSCWAEWRTWEIFLQQALCKTTSEARWVSPGHPYFAMNRHTLKIWVLHWEQSQEVGNQRMEAEWECSLSYQNLLYFKYPKARPRIQQCFIIAGLQSKRSARMRRNLCYSKTEAHCLWTEIILVISIAPFWKVTNHRGKKKIYHWWSKHVKALQKLMSDTHTTAETSENVDLEMRKQS